MGTGGIGGYYGARLAQVGADVFFVARGPHLEAIQKNGLKITSVKGDFEITSVNASSNPNDAGPVDVIIFATKAWDIESAASLIKPALKESGIVVHFQNGVDTPERLASVIDRKKIVGGVAYGVMNIAGPGRIDNSTQIQELIYGTYDGSKSDSLEEFHSYCKRAVFNSQLVPNIEVHLWTKFLFICAFSGITSLIRKPIGPILAEPETYQLFYSCMSEIKKIADEKKIPLPASIMEDRMKFAKSLEPTATSSMQRDLKNGNHLELAALNGMVSCFGKKLGILTPVNDFIFSVLKLHA